MLASHGAPRAWRALAEANREAGRLQGALAACQAGLERAPSSPDLLHAKAETLRLLGRLDEAAATFRATLQRAPGHDAARFGLALVAVDAGEPETARRELAPLVAAAPDRPEVRWLSARAALLAGEPASARRELKELLQRAMPPAREADARLLMAEACDQLGDYSAAFALAAAGKALQRQLYKPQATARESALARLRRLEIAFRGLALGDFGGLAATGPQPVTAHVFLVGFPRSGTTLLEQALAGHPAVTALEEAPTLAGAHQAFLESAAGLARLAALTAAEAEGWRDRYWAEVARHGVTTTGRVFLDKQPAGTEDLPLVAKLFPKAKILFAVRDPRDVVLSCFRQNFRMNALTYAFTDLVETAACYDANFRLAEVYRRVLPLHVLDVRHEALIADFEAGLRRICDFIGLEFDPAMTDLATTARSRVVRTPSAPQVRAGLNTKGVGRWRAYAQALAPVRPVLDPWAERLDYPP